jgi:hypothetical protein
MIPRRSPALLFPEHYPKKGNGSAERSTLSTSPGRTPTSTSAAAANSKRCAVNANCDALEREAREGRIGVDAYWAGFTLQALLERSHGLLAPPNREFLAPMGGNKVAGQAHAMMKRMEKAKFMTEQFRAIQAIVGMTGMRILTLCLIGKLDGKGPCTFSEVAESLGMGVGSYGANDDGAASKRLKNEGIKVGWAFRNSLDLLASHWEYGSAPALPKYGWR